MSAHQSKVEPEAVGGKTDFSPNDLAHRNRLQALLSAQRRSLQLIAGGARLIDVLRVLCETIDAQGPEIISTILLMDSDGEKLWPAAGRRVPEGWTQAIAPLPIGPQMLASGTAAFLQKAVFTTDITSDPRWCVVEGTDYKNLALSYRLRAAWSYPLISRDDEDRSLYLIDQRR